MKWGKKQLIVDENGQSVTVKGTDGTVYVQGTSDVTVTVGSYSTNVDNLRCRHRRQLVRLRRGQGINQRSKFQHKISPAPEPTATGAGLIMV